MARPSARSLSCRARSSTSWFEFASACFPLPPGEGRSRPPCLLPSQRESDGVDHRPCFPLPPGEGARRAGEGSLEAFDYPCDEAPAARDAFSRDAIMWLFICCDKNQHRVIPNPHPPLSGHPLPAGEGRSRQWRLLPSRTGRGTESTIVPASVSRRERDNIQAQQRGGRFIGRRPLPLCFTVVTCRRFP